MRGLRLGAEAAQEGAEILEGEGEACEGKEEEDAIMIDKRRALTWGLFTMVVIVTIFAMWIASLTGVF